MRQHIGYIYRGKGIKMPMRHPSWSVMEGNRFRNGDRESPKTKQVGSNLGTSDSTDFFLDLIMRPILFPRYG